MEVNADMNSNCTEPTCNSAIASFFGLIRKKEDAHDQTPFAENSSILFAFQYQTIYQYKNFKT